MLARCHPGGSRRGPPRRCCRCPGPRLGSSAGPCPRAGTSRPTCLSRASCASSLDVDAHLRALIEQLHRRSARSPVFNRSKKSSMVSTAPMPGVYQRDASGRAGPTTGPQAVSEAAAGAAATRATAAEAAPAAPARGGRGADADGRERCGHAAEVGDRGARDDAATRAAAAPGSPPRTRPACMAAGGRRGRRLLGRYPSVRSRTSSTSWCSPRA